MLINNAVNYTLMAALIWRTTDALVNCTPAQIGSVAVTESMASGSVILATSIVCEGRQSATFGLRFSPESTTPAACDQFTFAISDPACHAYTSGSLKKKSCTYGLSIKVGPSGLDYERAQLRECRRKLIASKWAVVDVIILVENEVSECNSTLWEFITINTLVTCDCSLNSNAIQ